jgi:hypothetical protein
VILGRQNTQKIFPWPGGLPAHVIVKSSRWPVCAILP